MNLDLLQIILILWLIERTFVIRPRYKLAFVSHSYWNYGKLQKRKLVYSATLPERNRAIVHIARRRDFNIF
jgi:hypothetical protein